MKGKRYTDEFKKEAVKQVTDRGYSVSEVAKRLGTTTHRSGPHKLDSAISAPRGYAAILATY